jgi:AcrR family transcriptional regulator
MATDGAEPRRFLARSPRRPALGVGGARQAQKEATRARVLAAARELFDTQGYQGTTIREIARHARVSVGSVFTCYASKGEILSAVMDERLEGLYAELDRVVPHLRGSTADRLRSIFAIFFSVEATRAKLFLSHIAAAFDWTLPPSARPYGRNLRLRDILRDTVVKGVADGELRPDLDVDEVTALLMASYAWTYRLVVTEAADAKALTEVMDRQIGLIVDGLRPAAS